MANVKYLSKQFYRGTPVQTSYPPVQTCLQLLESLLNPLSAIFSPSIGNLHLGYRPFDTPFDPQCFPPYLNLIISPGGFNFFLKKLVSEWLLL